MESRQQNPSAENTFDPVHSYASKKKNPMLPSFTAQGLVVQIVSSALAGRSSLCTATVAPHHLPTDKPHTEVKRVQFAARRILPITGGFGQLHVAYAERAARPLTSYRFMKGLHYSLPIVHLRFCHERLLKRLIVELLHIFGYLGKTEEKLPFSQRRRRKPTQQMCLKGTGSL